MDLNGSVLWRKLWKTWNSFINKYIRIQNSSQYKETINYSFFSLKGAKLFLHRMYWFPKRNTSLCLLSAAQPTDDTFLFVCLSYLQPYWQAEASLQGDKHLRWWSDPVKLQSALWRAITQTPPLLQASGPKIKHVRTARRRRSVTGGEREKKKPAWSDDRVTKKWNEWNVCSSAGSGRPPSSSSALQLGGRGCEQRRCSTPDVCKAGLGDNERLMSKSLAMNI